MYKFINGLLFGFFVVFSAHATLDEVCKVDSFLVELASKKQLIMFGEIHGTEEMPAYVARVLCALSGNKRPVKIGMEYLPSQLPFINSYIESTGLDDDKTALVGNAYWSHQYQDGRTSSAMFRLIDQIRVLRQSGKDVRVFLFDDQSSANRDKAMAENIANELNNDPNTQHILITGNIHSQVVKGVPWDQSYMTMGTYLSESTFDLASILLTHAGGNAWVCAPECKETALQAKSDNSIKPVNGLLKESRDQKHSYHLNVGEINSSMPAYLNVLQDKD